MQRHCGKNSPVAYLWQKDQSWDTLFNLIIWILACFSSQRSSGWSLKEGKRLKTYFISLPPHCVQSMKILYVKCSPWLIWCRFLQDRWDAVRPGRACVLQEEKIYTSVLGNFLKRIKWSTEALLTHLRINYFFEKLFLVLKKIIKIKLSLKGAP